MAAAPDSDDRFAPARALDHGRRAAELLRADVRPQWAADSQSFHYDVRTAGGLRTVHIDIATRSRHTTDAPLPPAAFGPHEAAAPDGSAAVSRTGHDLALRRPGEPQSRALTDDGEADFGWGSFTDFVSQLATRSQAPPASPSVLWSPDSTRFAVMRADLRGLPRRHLLQMAPDTGGQPVLHSFAQPTPRDKQRAPLELWLIGTDGRRARARIDGLECSGFTPLAAGWLRWARDGRSLLLVDGSRDAKRLALWRIDAVSGLAWRVLEESGPAVVLPAPSIAEPAIVDVLADGRVLWWSQRSGWGHLYLVQPDGRAQALTRGEWQVRSVLHVDEADGRIVFTAGGREAGVDPYFNAAYSVAFDGTGLTLLTPEPAQHEFFAPAPGVVGPRSVSPDGRWLVDNHSTPDLLPRAVLRDRRGTFVMDLEQAEWPAAIGAAVPRHEAFSVTALDGHTRLWGALYRPGDFDPARRYPVIEVIYGAPQTAVVPKSWVPNRFGAVAEQLAVLGFVVVIVDGPGAPYRSHAFQLASYGRIESCGGLPDHVHTLRSLAVARPWMDLSRLGIVGASGGGYATARALADHADFYRAGVSMCGNHDQSDYVAMWGERYQGLFSDARYATQSSISVADRITAPLLLMHGDMDDNVHPSHTLRLADALMRAGRTFEMVLVPNAGHMLILLPWVQERIWQFFMDHLGVPHDG